MKNNITSYQSRQGRIWCSLFIFLLAMVIFSGFAMAQAEKKAEKSPNDLRVYWSNGLRFETQDKAFTFKLGGRIMNDWAFVTEDEALEPLGDLAGGTEFRRARLYLSGVVHKRIEFKLQVDFAGGGVVGKDVSFKDAFIGIKDLPVIGGIRMGHFKEPFGLEELTSSKYITFMERALPSAWYSSRNTGFMIHNRIADQRMSWAVGVFKAVGNSAGTLFSSENNWRFTGRFTGLPLYKDSGRQMIHLGFSYSYQQPPLNTVLFRQRPEAHLSPRFITTGTFDADNVNIVNPEVALVVGPFSAQAEYTAAIVDTPTDNDPSFSGHYIQASYFLTGENRAYSRSSAAFSRVKPKRNLGSDGGAGAWEIAFRYSSLDLTDVIPVTDTGGKLRNFTVGLNWHLNPITRFMFNYINTNRYDNVVDDVDTLDGTAHFFMMRFQIDF